MTMMARLPPELIDRIIDFLHDNKPTLAVCSLVCRNWVATSRLHYFESLVIDPVNVDRLVDLFRSPSCTISTVAYLDIGGETSCSLDAFIAIEPWLSRLTIRRLILRYLQWTWSNPVSVAMLSWFERIVHLEIRGTEFPDLTSFTRLIQSFHSLHTLILGYEFDIFSTEVIHAPFRPLYVLDDTSVSIMQFPAIASLALEHSSEGSIFLQSFLQSLGPSLSELELSYEDSGPGYLLDLIHNTNLQSIAIDMFFHYGYIQGNFIPNIFTTINSSRLTHAKIYIWVKNINDIDTINWRHLDHILDQPRFISLKKLLIIMRYSYQIDSDACGCKISEQMPSQNRRGVLKFISLT